MASESVSVSWLEELGPTLSAAKITLPQLLPEVQCMSFASDYGSEDTMLMEMTEAMISQLESGANLTIRGTTDDSAALCTDCETFEVKLREVSNVLLISPDVNASGPSAQNETERIIVPKNVQYMHGGFLELRPLIPRCARAKHLLEETPFTGLDFELESSSGKKYTFDELLDTVQSSREEMKHYLTEVINTSEIDGHVRLLSHSYVNKVVERVLDWVSSSSLTWDNIPDYEASSALLDLEPESVMRDFFWPRFSVRAGSTFRLLPDAIARTYAVTYLSTGEKSRCDEFLTWWTTIIPSVIPVDFREDLLHGLAYRTDNETPVSYIYLAVEDLPTEPDKRFRRLFQERRKWPREELLAYLVGISKDDAATEKLLTKFTKSITMDGISYLISSSLI